MLSHEAMLVQSVMGKSQPFYLDVLTTERVPTTQPSPERRASMDESDSKAAVKRVSHKQPPNTRVHKVKCGDKLTSLAAHCDTTPSLLKNLNKLSTDFLYPNQIIFLPVSESYTSPSHINSVSSSGDPSSDSDFYSSCSCEEDKPSLGSTSKKSSISSNEPEHKIWSPPARRAAFNIPASYTEASQSFEYFPGESSETETNQRFVKLSSSYIVPDKEETVRGTLLVTPNAVMFDPYVSDPLVLERGVEEFGMIAKMDTVVSAAIYRNSEAMRSLHRLKLDPTAKKPSIYHLNNCEVNGDRKRDSAFEDEIAAPACLCGSLEAREIHDGSLEGVANKVVFDLMDGELDEDEEQAEQQLVDCSVTTRSCHGERNMFCVGEIDSCDVNIPSESKFEHCSRNSAVSRAFSAPAGSCKNLYIDYKCGMFAPDSNAALHKPSENSCQACSKPYTVANNKAKCPLYIKAGVGREEKPHLFKPIGDLISSTNSQGLCQPFYLCLQVGERLEQCRITDTCPIEAYKKKRKRPEYWFTIPSDLADSLYNFFIQWRPELYGEEITDPAILCSKGFVSIPESSVSPISSSIPRSPMIRQLSHTRLVKNWEVLSVEEIARRQSLLDIQKYVPFPDMTSRSLLLSDEQIKKLAAVLPARVEGHQWQLAYCTEEHGFSLSTLYRNMSEFDSATVLVVQDENGALFGAFSSLPIQHREHFYGNGECFLFSLVDGFKVYKWTGSNMFCVRGDLQGLTLGTGRATCGLWLDAGLYHGLTQHCDTFDNDPLTGAQEDFIIKGIEVWSLMDEF